jgi:hypothetical protein
MANNRIFLFNKVTKEAMMLAKSFGRGWEIRETKKALEEFMSKDDWDSSCVGEPSNLILLTELELPKDTVYYKKKSIGG